MLKLQPNCFSGSDQRKQKSVSRQCHFQNEIFIPEITQIKHLVVSSAGRLLADSTATNPLLSGQQAILTDT